MKIEDFIIRLSVALLLGIIIGFERQWRLHSAGLRTNTLVCIGAALFMLLSIKFNGYDSGSRVAAQIVTGIGFLGAGVIMKEGLNIHGLNTAATIWATSAIGTMSGMGLLFEAAIGTCAIVLVHLILRPLGNKLDKIVIHSEVTATRYLIIAKTKKSEENSIRVLFLKSLTNDSLHLQSLKSQDEPPDHVEISAEIFAFGKQDTLIENITSLLTLEESTNQVSWHVLQRHND